MNKNIILSVHGLCKKYKNFELKDINIAIPKGTIVGFIGENGAGKTTTIKSILNLIKIDSGKITIFNKEYDKNGIEIKEDLGIVLSDSFMPESMNPNDINKVLKKMYSNWNEKLFFDYLCRFNLPTDKIIKEFSTGMLVKLKIITALSHNPKLLILDEPTSGLDPIARMEILDIFQEFIEDENHSIFVSSHITSDLEQVADYIIFIKDGKIILREEKDTMLEKYAIVKCTADEFNKINKKDIIKYKKAKYEYQILIKDKNDFKKKYKINTIDRPSLDEIMYLYIKGENNE